MDLSNILGFTVVAAFVTVAGNLLALYLKDYLGARSFERWKAEQSLIALYARYRKPIALAAKELGGRFYAIAIKHADGNRENVGLHMLQLKDPLRVGTAAADHHFLQYRFVSDAYRICCFLGWIELYRRDLGLLDAGAERQNNALEICLGSIRNVLADGDVNGRKDRAEYYDVLIFREEQRAIGHRMIASEPERGLIDFGTFCERLEKDPEGDADARWFVAAARFFSELRDVKDFRIIRMQLLVVHLTELRTLLVPNSVHSTHITETAVLAKRLTHDGDLRPYYG